MNSIGSLSVDLTNRKLKLENNNGYNIGNKFNSILTSHLNKEQSNVIEEITVPTEIINSLMNLLSYLDFDSLNELGGTEPTLETSILISNVDTEDLILNYLSMTPEQILNSIYQMNGKLNIVSNYTFNNLLDDGEILNNLSLIISKVIKSETKEFERLINEDFNTVVKVAKILELVLKTNNQGTRTEGLTQILEQLKSKMSNMIPIEKTKLPHKETINNTLWTNLGGTLKMSKIISANGTLELKDTVVMNTGNITFMQPMSRPEQLTLMLGNTQNNVSSEDLMKQFESILIRSQFTKSNGLEKLLIKLAPEHLGSMQIEIIKKDQMLVARIVTSTEMAKDTLESQINTLRNALANQNISFDKLEVTQEPSLQDRSNDKNQKQNQEQKEETTKDQNETKLDFNDSLVDAQLNIEI